MKRSRDGREFPFFFFGFISFLISQVFIKTRKWSVQYTQKSPLLLVIMIKEKCPNNYLEYSYHLMRNILEG